MQTQVVRTQPSGLHASSSARARTDAPSAIFGLVAAELAQTELRLHQELQSQQPAVTEIGRYLAAAGGKRLRPLLTALGARAAGFTGDPSRLMCVGELLHLGSLLHDDVVDEAETRRGRPAAHRVYTNAAVILTGDWCMSRGLTIAAEEAGLTAVLELTRTVSDMSLGEVQQLLNAGNLDLDAAAYFQVIEAKSASLIAWCAASGAWAANQPQHALALGRYGRKVGSAFQVADDVLDYVGDTRLTGKLRGQDLLQRKLTLPLLFALERLPELRERLAARPPAPAELEELTQQIRDCGAARDALAAARELASEAQDSLLTLPDTPARAALHELAHYLVERVS